MIIGSTGCDIKWAPNKFKQFSNLDSFVLANDFNDTFGIQQADWIRRSLFDNYFLDSTIFQDNSLFSNYIYSNSNSDLFKLANIKSQFNKLMHNNEYWDNYNNNLINYYSLSDSLSELLSVYPENPDSIYSEAALEQFNLLRNNADTSYQMFTQYFDDNISSLQSLIDNFTPNSEWASRTKQYYGILANVLSRDSAYLNQNEIDTLVLIANLCTLSFGEVVYDAANLLDLADTVISPSQNSCFPPLNNPIKSATNIKKSFEGENSISDLKYFDSRLIEIYTLDGSIIFKGFAESKNLASMLKNYPGILIIRDLELRKTYKYLSI